MVSKRNVFLPTKGRTLTLETQRSEVITRLCARERDREDRQTNAPVSEERPETKPSEEGLPERPEGVEPAKPKLEGIDTGTVFKCPKCWYTATHIHYGPDKHTLRSITVLNSGREDSAPEGEG